MVYLCKLLKKISI